MAVNVRLNFCIVWILVLLSKHSIAVILSPDIREFSAYVREGDVNIGYMTNIHSTAGCDGYVSTGGTINTEQVAFAVNNINKLPHVLPNVTLGFVILDSCGSELRALARAVYYLRDNTSSVPPTPDWDAYPSDTEMILPGSEREAELFRVPTQYDVEAVIGLSTSRYTVTVASLLSAFQLPLISQSATSDELTDPTRFPHFMRVVPPDRFSAQALVDIALHFNWSYMSLVYSEGSYGEHGAKEVERLVREAGLSVCLAFSHRISTTADDEDYVWVARRLYEQRRARVVLLFCEGRQQRGLMAALRRLGLTHTFLFLVSDVFSPSTDINEGALYVAHHVNAIPHYRQHLSQLSPWTNPANPWLPRLWQRAFDCTWDNDTSDEKTSCFNYTMPESWVRQYGSGSSRLYDAVYVLAYGLHDHVTRDCSHALHPVDKVALRECINGNKLMESMLNLSFHGLTGHISFDDEGDMLGEYDLLHYTRQANGSYTSVVVGEWSKLNGAFFINMSLINWTFYEDIQDVQAETHVIPESICSKPCAPGQYYILQEVTCCWQCQDCRQNEIMTENLTSCQTCPLNTWPNPLNYNECLPIYPDYLVPDSPVGTSLLVLAVVAALLTLWTMVVFWSHRDHRLVMATSRELSWVILIGTLLAAADVGAFIAKPSRVSCLVRMLGFHYSFSLLYSPLVVKTVRIFRIFHTGRRAVRRPRFVSSASQMILTAALILILTVMMVVLELVSPVTPRLAMPVVTEQFVELACHQSSLSFLLPLSLNLSLILLSLIIGYLSRKLPENFNESRYIFVSVATTLFAWVVFLPTYFTAFYDSQKVILLAFSLLVNSYITLGFLFGPKIYAIYFIADRQIKFRGTFTNTMSSDRRIAPATVSKATDRVDATALASTSNSKQSSE